MKTSIATFFLVCTSYLIVGTTLVRAGSEACPAGDSCYPQRSNDQSMACNPTCIGPVWECSWDRSKSCSALNPCESYEGPCTRFCTGGYGSCDTLAEHTIKDCNTSPGNCQVDGIKNCYMTGGVCQESSRSFGCCGGSTEPPPIDPGDPPEPDPTTASCSIAAPVGPVTLGLDQVGSYSANMTWADGTFQKVEFIPYNSHTKLNPSSTTTDSSAPSPFTTSYRALATGQVLLKAKGYVSGATGVVTCESAPITITVVEPTCTMNANSLGGPTTLDIGESGTYAVPAASVTPVNGTIQRVDFIASNANLSPTPPASPSDITAPYSAAFTGRAVGTSRITANGYVNGVVASKCNDYIDVTVSRPTTTIQANVYRADNDFSCAGTSKNFSIDPSFYADYRLFHPVNGTAGYPRPGMSSSGNSFANVSYGGVEGAFANPYNLSLVDFPEPWVLLTCSGAPTRQITLNSYPLNATYEQNYWFAYRSDPWWQVIGGDIFAATSMTTTIPPTAEAPYIRAMNNVGGADNDTSGVLIAGTTVDVNAGSGRIAPEYPGKNRGWITQGSSYSNNPQEGYEFFVGNFELGDLTASQESFGAGLRSFTGFVGPTAAHTYADNSTVYYHEGNLEINTLYNHPATVKATVFVKGNLIIRQNVTVPVGSFLAFIVDGNITIEGNVSQVEGVYIADNPRNIANTGILTIQGLDVVDQFVGEGVFVGWDGVGLERTLSSPAEQGLDNNKFAAEQFFYRGDFVVSAPEGFLRSGIEWQEVVPQNVSTPTDQYGNPL